MAQTIQLLIPNSVNESLQVGDVVYYSQVLNSQGGRNHPVSGHNSKPSIIGRVTDINRTTRIVGVFSSLNGWQINNVFVNKEPYLFFRKDTRANYSGIIGYFMEVEYRNYSSLKSEIFATAVDYADSSR